MTKFDVFYSNGLIVYSNITTSSIEAAIKEAKHIIFSLHFQKKYDSLFLKQFSQKFEDTITNKEMNDLHHEFNSMCSNIFARETPILNNNGITFTTT